MPALLWGTLLIAASLPACWFGARLAVAPLTTRAVAATALLAELGGNEAEGPVECGPADRGPADRGPADRGPADRGPADRGTGAPVDEFAAFGRAGRTLLRDFDAAVEAVSISGDGGAELEGLS
jgi:hypothetical protein